MSTEYIDVSEISLKHAGAYISRIAATEHPVLVFMPNLNYTGMGEAEDLAAKFNIGFIVLPITLPMADLTRQMEFSGVRIHAGFIAGMESSFRRGIIEQLNIKEGQYGHQEC